MWEREAMENAEMEKMNEEIVQLELEIDENKEEESEENQREFDRRHHKYLEEVDEIRNMFK